MTKFNSDKKCNLEFLINYTWSENSYSHCLSLCKKQNTESQNQSLQDISSNYQYQGVSNWIKRAHYLSVPWRGSVCNYYQHREHHAWNQDVPKANNREHSQHDKCRFKHQGIYNKLRVAHRNSDCPDHAHHT